MGRRVVAHMHYCDDHLPGWRRLYADDARFIHIPDLAQLATHFTVWTSISRSIRRWSKAIP